MAEPVTAESAQLPAGACPPEYRRVAVHSTLGAAWALIRESFRHPRTGTCLVFLPKGSELE